MTDALIMAAAAINKKRDERRKKIYEFIKTKGLTSNCEIAKELGLSRTTVGSDVAYLKKVYPEIKTKGSVGTYYKEEPRERKVISIEILWNDLTLRKQAEIREKLNMDENDNGNWDVIPMVIMEIEEKDDAS